MRHRVTCVFQTFTPSLSLVVLTLSATIFSIFHGPHVYGQSTQVPLESQTQKPITLPASPESPDWPTPEVPVLRTASEEGQQAIAQFKFPKSLECKLYAAEPDVANIVALHRDFQGRMFVCETYRQDKGVEDNRSHQNWMDDELATMAATPDKLDSQLLAVVTALTAKRDAATAMPLIEAGLNRDEQTTSQALIATLGTMNDDASRKILADALEAMIADKYSPALRLYIIIAAKQRKLDALNDLLSVYATARSKRDKDPLVATHLDAALGGDIKRGKDIFHNKTVSLAFAATRSTGTAATSARNLQTWDQSTIAVTSSKRLPTQTP